MTGGANKGILVAPGLDWDGWSSGHQGRGALVSRHYNFQVSFSQNQHPKAEVKLRPWFNMKPYLCSEQWLIHRSNSILRLLSAQPGVNHEWFCVKFFVEVGGVLLLLVDHCNTLPQRCKTINQVNNAGRPPVAKNPDIVLKELTWRQTKSKTKDWGKIHSGSGILAVGF